MKKSRIIYIIIGAVYFLLVITATVYSITIYQHNLAKAYLTHARSGTIFYSQIKTGALEKSNAISEFMDYAYVVNLFFAESSIPRTFIQEGSQLEVELSEIQGSTVTGEIIHKEDAKDESGTTVSVGFSMLGTYYGGESVNVMFKGESPSYACVIPRKAVNTSFDGRHYINLVQEEDGPWGKQFVIKQYYINIWPFEEDVEEVSIFPNNLSYPMVGSSNGPLFEGQVVQLDMDTNLE
jgi:hypothetical protein